MYFMLNAAVAVKYGVPEAIFIHNIYWWAEKNRANGQHFYEGRAWTYNSLDAFAELFPFWSQSQVKRLVKKLEEAGGILLGNFNKKAFDRTRWYAVSDDVLELYRGTISSVPLDETVPPIPDSKPDIRDILFEVSDETPNQTKKYDEESKPYKCAAFLSKRIKERIPNKVIPERQLQSWAYDFDKTHRLDKQDWQTIAAVLDFSQTDDFWQRNILSGGKFRKQFDQLFLNMQKEIQQ